MRICNVLALDEQGARTATCGSTVTIADVGCLRFEPSFVFQPCTIWASFYSDARCEYKEPIYVTRETIAVFVAVPPIGNGVRLTCSITLDENPLYETHIISVGRTATIFESLEFARHSCNKYHHTRDAIINLGFVEMLEQAAALATAARAQLIFVTGSVGKTSTKELIAYLMRAKGVCQSTDSWNFPHEIASQIALNVSWARYFVMEVAVGDHLATVGRHLPPDVLVFTQLGPVHTRSIGNVSRIAKFKAALGAYMRDSAVAVLNADVPAIGAAIRGAWQATNCGASIRWFGELDRSPTDVLVTMKDNRLTLVDRIADRQIELSKSKLRAIQPTNLAGAYCVTAVLGESVDDLRSDLDAYTGVPSRLEHVPINGKLLVKDAYNANPVSMMAFLETLEAYSKEGKRVCAILGEMADLGSGVMLEHKKIVAKAATVATHCILVGRRYTRIPIDRSHTTHHQRIDALEDRELLRSLVSQFDVIGVKGSYRSGMIKVSFALEQALRDSTTQNEAMRDLPERG